MSWLRNSSIGASLGKLRGTTSPSKDFDLSACHDSFKKHWQQIHDIIERTQETERTAVKQDDVLAVVSNLDQMVTLLVLELKSNQKSGPCLEHVLSENLLDCLYSWTLKTGKYVTTLRIEQLKLYEVLVSHSHTQLLVHEAFHRPLLRLLLACSDAAFHEELEKGLVVLLNQLCVSLVHHQELLQLFFHSGNSSEPEFIIFSLLIPFIHRDGLVGQQARDALLFCMSLSKQSEVVATFIVHQSNVCPVLAAGLGGLYSLLPCSIPIESVDWFRLTPEDVGGIQELSVFMNSLEFCNAVVQVAHPMVSSQLLGFLHQGFLVPVMGPALLQNSSPELITSTAYFELFLRSLSEPGLIHSFLRLLFKDVYDDQRIIDCLIQRINSSGRLSIITLSLMETLIDLNCEDVMMDLVFRYLLPCNHVMASQRCKLSGMDLYCRSAEKFLQLSPDIERSENIEGSLYGDYFEYLLAARHKIKACAYACAVWVYTYDGTEQVQSDAQGGTMFSDNEYHSLISADDVSSGYESFARTGDMFSEGSGPESYSPTNSEICQESKNPSGIFNSVPTIGPFMEALFNKLENMPNNDLYVNLSLTGVISRLAIFPQPLLRSFLLDHSLVFQPTIKSLFQTIGQLKQRIENMLKNQHADDLKLMIEEGEKLLLERERSTMPVKRGPPSSLPSNLNSEPFNRNDSKRRSLSASLNAVFRRTNPSNIQLQPVNSGYRYSVNNNVVQNVALCAILLTEWLRELAAISQEHIICAQQCEFEKNYK